MIKTQAVNKTVYKTYNYVDLHKQFKKARKNIHILASRKKWACIFSKFYEILASDKFKLSQKKVCLTTGNLF